MKSNFVTVCLALVSIPVYAVVFAGGALIFAGYSVNETVTANLGLNLSGAGTYSATSWSINVNLSLVTPGTYIVSGRAVITGDLRGPSLGTATIRFIDGVTISGSTAQNVTVLTGPIPPPPTSEPAVVAPVTPGANSAAPLVNISTRATLANGGSLSPGFVIGGSLNRRVLIRAVGPGLAPFGVTNPLPPPRITVFRGSTEIASNAGWAGSPSMAAAFAAIGAFPLASTSDDAALVISLSPGDYTARVTGGGPGEVLLEVYFVD